MSRLIVTAGNFFTDIDAYASVVAYTQLEVLSGVEAEAVLVGPLNVSVPPFLRLEQSDYSVDYEPRQNDRFVVLDVSDPENIAKFVDFNRIESIIDHHFGYEDYWKERGVVTVVEPIGAACTQIFERWEGALRLNEMPQRTATLLAAGILDNTLNFSSNTTSQRDRHAYQRLLRQASLDETFSQVYFEACQQDAERDIKDAIVGDSKIIAVTGFARRIKIGQLALWDARDALDVVLELSTAWLSQAEPYFINLISISEQKSYIISKDAVVRAFLGSVTGFSFSGDIATTDRLWLRKEILEAANSKALT